MIDPVVSIAFSLSSTKGAYALLLGSGLSRSAGIPTGWEVTIDLIRKVARLRGEDPEPDPTAWFTTVFRSEPDYPTLMNSVARSPAERMAILRGYFEPTAEEQGRGIKTPTLAHKAIAELSRQGYVRVILTTNFDRLLERALEGAGIVPTVISTPDAARGAIPLTHAQCTIVKLHGDYLDTRIRNTPSELAQYDAEIDRLLDRVFDEFGLIICGWSADWDAALRAALERCQSYRFTTYWCVRSHPSEQTQRLIQLRRGVTIDIRDADSFFEDLAAKVMALEEYGRPHPLSVKVAVATLKAYLPEDRYKIQIHDLVLGELEKVYGQLSPQNFPVQGIAVTADAVEKRLKHYEGLTEILFGLVVIGCYWDSGRYRDLWVRCVTRLAHSTGDEGGVVAWLKARAYPALLLLYGGGMASITASQYGTFKSLLFDATIKESGTEVPVISEIFPARVVQTDLARQISGYLGEYTPVNSRLHSVLREPLKELLPEDDRYESVFDRFEYLFGLAFMDMNRRLSGDSWAPVGRFAWKHRWEPTRGIVALIEDEVKEWGEEWPLLRAGLFDGSLERLSQIMGLYKKEVLEKLHWG